MLKRWLIAGLTIDEHDPDEDSNESRKKHMNIWTLHLADGSPAELERFAQLAEEQGGVLTAEQKAEVKAILKL